MASWRNITALSYQEIRDLQDRKLRHFLREQVYPFSPYYRRIFDEQKIDLRRIRGVADLKYLPFVSKADLVSRDDPQRFMDFILQPDLSRIRASWPRHKLLGLFFQSLIRGRESVQNTLAREYRPIFMTFTTGTTNSPVPVTYSRRDLDNLCLSGSRMVSLFNINPDERIMNIFPFAPHLAFWQTFFGALEANVFALSTGGGKVMGTEGNLTALKRTRPSVILGVPSYIYHMIRVARERKDDLSFLKKIVLGAGRVTPEYKQKLSAMLAECGAGAGAGGAAIFGTYGFTEARMAWAECPTENNLSSGYHLYPDKEIFEIIDPQTGAVKADGEDGELVYTPLDSRASVILRYRTGDFVKGGIRHEPCPYCGRRTLRLSSDISRLSDIKGLQLSKIKGVLVNMDHFAGVFNGMPEVDEWQIEIRKHNNDPHDSDELVVYVTPGKEVNEAAFADKLKDRLMGATELAPNEIRFIPLHEMVKRLELETANKEKRILDIRGGN